MLVFFKHYEDIVLLITKRETKQKIRKKKLWWWVSNPEHVDNFHEQEDIKLIKKRETNKFLRFSPFKYVSAT